VVEVKVVFAIEIQSLALALAQAAVVELVAEA
jgi:hypothetical protein